MEVLRRKVHILAAGLALLCSCEQRFEVEVSDSQPRMFIRCFVSPYLEDKLNIYKAVPVGGKTGEAANFTLTSMSVKADGEPVSIGNKDSQPGSWSLSGANPSEGSSLVLSLEAEGMPAVSAVSSIPKMVWFKADTASVMDVLQFTIEFDHTVKESTKLAVAVVCRDEKDNGFCFSCSLTGVAAETVLPGVLPFPDTRFSNLRGAIFSGKELSEGNLLRFTVSPYARDVTYSLLVYTLSDEAYGYLNTQYQIDNNFLAMLGLAPSSFAYSNISGGYGVFAGYTMRIMYL